MSISTINAQKEIIMDALSNIEQAIRDTGDQLAIAQFESYVKGGVEQAMTDFGCHNICVEYIVKYLEQSAEFDEEECEDCGLQHNECIC